MCCFIMTVGFFGPRLGFLVWWLIAPLRVNSAFDTFIWPLLGLIFLPWATLAYVVLFPMTGLDWLLVALAAVLDIATWAGSGTRRKSVPGYPSTAP
jgi:hypothetical protein